MNQNKPSKNSPNVKPTILSQQFSGPIPPASELERYEQIMPGLADRIMKQAELEQSERHKNQRSLIELEIQTSKSEVLTSRFKIIVGFISVCVIVWLCYFAFVLGYKEQARDIAVYVIVSLAAIFVIGKLSNFIKKD